MNITEEAYNIFVERVSDHYPKAGTSDVDILNSYLQMQQATMK